MKILDFDVSNMPISQFWVTLWRGIIFFHSAIEQTKPPPPPAPRISNEPCLMSLRGILCSDRGQSGDAFQAILLKDTCPKCNNYCGDSYAEIYRKTFLVSLQCRKRARGYPVRNYGIFSNYLTTERQQSL